MKRDRRVRRKPQGNVQCRVCGVWLGSLGPFHLKMHGLTTEAYRAAYPDAPLHGSARNRKLSLNNGSKRPEVRRLISRTLKKKAHRKVTHAVEGRLIRFYRQTRSARLTAQKFGIHSVTVHRTLRRLRVRRLAPPRPAVAASRRYNVNHAAFSVASPAALYWAGFVAADGYVQAPRTLRVLLSARDRTHLEKLRTFLHSESPIRSCIGRIGGREFPQVRFEVHSEQIVADLARLGVAAGTKDRCIPRNETVRSRDFFRGMVDGDGCLGWWNHGGKTRPRITFAGRRPIVEAFIRWGRTAAPWWRAQPLRHGRRVFQVEARCRLAQALVRALYERAAVSLDRKARIAKAIARHYDGRPVSHQALSAKHKAARRAKSVP